LLNIDIHIQIHMLEEGGRIRKRLDKKIKHNQALAKRVIEFMRNERDKKEASKKMKTSLTKKEETTKDMVT
jgi:hypothetical protein